MIITKLFYKIFKIVPTLNVTNDSKQGSITTIFIHGIASNSDTWKPVLPLVPNNYRTITIDLLGFATSPKPNYLQYTTKDHAKALEKTVKKLKLNESFILVGHSMGGLIAVEYAKNNSKMIKKLILVSTPLYNSQDVKRQVKAYKNNKNTITNILFYVYEKLIDKQYLTLKAVQHIIKITPAGFPLMLNEASWYPFKMSLQNTIMNQTTVNDIIKLKAPTTCIYGRLDPVIVTKNYTKLMVKRPDIKQIKTSSMHILNKAIAKKIINEIN